MASATVFANSTQIMTGVTYVRVPVSCNRRRSATEPNQKRAARTSNIITASETVVLVTPASVAAAPTIE